MAFANYIMAGHGISNKVCQEHLPQYTKVELYSHLQYIGNCPWKTFANHLYWRSSRENIYGITNSLFTQYLAT